MRLKSATLNMLLKSPWLSAFDALIAEAQSSLVICAPYIGKYPCKRLSEQVRLYPAAVFRISILTDLSRDNILSCATDIAAIAELARTIPFVDVRFLPSLHAKVYVADETSAIITSGNFTIGGMIRNFEYGIRIDDSSQVQTVRRDELEYAALGSPVSTQQLQFLEHSAMELREMRTAAERSIRSSIKREFDRLLSETSDEILRIRASGRTSHSMFADTILHLLKDGPLRTTEINSAVQRIHPDLCDDTIDRVIDGQHFGKKWKHGVRTSQVFLRRKGRIKLEDGKWHKC